MASMEHVVARLQELIAFRSVSCFDNSDIAACVRRRLQGLGFDVETSTYQDRCGVLKTNLVGCRRPKVASQPGTPPANAGQMNQPRSNETGSGSVSGVAYFCHSDVVPAESWTGPGAAFESELVDGRVYGRGSCDMKGSLVAMLEAIDRFDVERQSGPIWVVCTADEEVAFGGAKALVKSSPAYRGIVDAQPVSLIGEPTSLEVVHAHKGIAGFEVVSSGRAAHSSTTDGINANIAMVPVLEKMCEIERRTRVDPRYHDARFEPPTLSWNFGVSDGQDAINVTPARSTAWGSLRPMPGIDGEDLIAEVASSAAQAGLSFRRFSGGDPVWIDQQHPIVQAIAGITKTVPRTVCYGTDGGEFAELDNRVVLGPGSIRQAHTSDEYITVDQLSKGIETYQRVLATFA